MEDLLMQYKKTLKNTKQQLLFLADSVSKEDLDDETIHFLNNLKDRNEYITFLKQSEQNLIFMISEIKKRMDYRIIDTKKREKKRLSLVEKIDAIYSTSDLYFQTFAADEVETEEEKYKKELVKAVMKTLSKKEQKILNLYTTGYTHVEIAKILNCERSTISKSITRSIKKIKEEGWLLLS